MKKGKFKHSLLAMGVLSIALFNGAALTSCEKVSILSSLSANDLSNDREAAINSLNSYLDKDKYRQAQQDEIDGIISDAASKIQAATSKESIESIVTETKTKLDAVKTDAELTNEEFTTAKANKLSEIETLSEKYVETNYSATNWAKIANYISVAKEAVNAMTTKAEIDAYTLDTLTANLNSIKVNASYASLTEAFPGIDFSFNTDIDTDVVADGETAITITSWADIWFSSNITIKNMTFKQGATFSARVANIDQDVTITFDNCIFYPCH